MEFSDLVASRQVLPHREGTEQRPLKEFSQVTAKNMHLDICRVCLGSSGMMVNIFNNTSELGKPIAEMLSLVTGHQVFKDEFSELICPPCLEDATKAFKIKQTYERSYQLLCQVKEDFQANEICKAPETQQVVDIPVKIESFNDDLGENGENLGVTVENEVLDASMYSQKDNGFEEDSLEHKELDQCPVKKEDSFEAEDYQIYDSEIQHENQPIKKRGKRYGSTIHKCPHCPRTFPSPGKLEQHIRSHTKVRPFKCPQCPSVFRTQRSVTLHLKSHVVDDPYKCSQCSCSFKAESSLKRHLTKHKDITKHKAITPFKCDLCQRSFTHKRTLESHRVNCVVMTKLIKSGALIVPIP